MKEEYILVEYWLFLKFLKFYYAKYISRIFKIYKQKEKKTPLKKHTQRQANTEIENETL